MVSRLYMHQCYAQSTNNVQSIPDTLLASQQPNPPRIFYVKLKVDFVDLHTVAGHHFTTYVREMSYPTDQVPLLIESVKAETSSFLDNLVGPHLQLLRDLNFRLTECTTEIVANPNHTERTVLPIEVHVYCMALTPAETPTATPTPTPIPVDAFVNVLMEEEEVEVMCTVCQEWIEVGSIASKVPCEHLFHQECIQNWLTSIVPASLRSCPNCRFALG